MSFTTNAWRVTPLEALCPKKEDVPTFTIKQGIGCLRAHSIEASYRQGKALPASKIRRRDEVRLRFAGYANKRF
jgi:hypothetical protein